MGEVAAIIDVFTSRSGFDAVWEECDEATRGDICAAIAGALQRQWQPIETAPRDERPMLVRRIQGNLAIAYYPRWNVAERPLLNVWTREEITATHWMPLPAGPEVADE